MIRTHGLTHISLSVSDLDVSLAFYATLFGVREYFRDETSLQVLGPGEYDVIAFELRDLRSRGGIHHFGFRLVDAEQVHEAARLAKELGATILRQGEHTPGEPYLYIEDPDGHEIEIWYEEATALQPVAPPAPR